MFTSVKYEVLMMASSTSVTLGSVFWMRYYSVRSTIMNSQLCNTDCLPINFKRKILTSNVRPITECSPVSDTMLSVMFTSAWPWLSASMFPRSPACLSHKKVI